MKKNQQEKSSTNKYNLSKEEKSNLDFRRAVGEYLMQIVQADIRAYSIYNVLTRLSIPRDSKFTLNADNTVIEVQDDPTKTE